MSVTVEHVITPALLERIQRRWGALLQRAGAREAAIARALVHARALEVVHRREIATLSGRLRGLERVVFDYVASHRTELRSGGAAPALLGAAAASASQPALLAPASAQRTLAHAQLDSSASAAATRLQPNPTSAPAPAPLDSAAIPAPAPFDPAAIVAAMLPLDEHDRDSAGVEEALRRLRSTGRATSRNHIETPFGRTQGTLSERILYAGVADEDATVEDEGDDWSAGELWSADGGPWFPRALRLLAAENPRAAGRLLLQLLPAQGLVWPEDVAYTLDIADTGCLNVSVSGDTTTIEPLLNIDPVHAPVLRSDLASLARTVTARRGWGRIGARLYGSRGRLRPLHALACAPLSLRDLQRQEVRLDPALLLALLVRAIDPAWTDGHELTVAFRCLDLPRASCFVHIDGRTAVAVTNTPPLGRVNGTLSFQAERLLDLLLSEDGDGAVAPPRHLASVGGEAEAVRLLLRWLRAVDATAAPNDAELATAA